jgi:Protein of unknown function (DUF3562)
MSTAEKQPDPARLVAHLAAEAHVPVADVAKLYERERAALAAEARVTKFLHIFAIRSVQEILRQRAADDAGTLTGVLPMLAL